MQKDHRFFLYLLVFFIFFYFLDKDYVYDDDKLINGENNDV